MLIIRYYKIMVDQLKFIWIICMTAYSACVWQHLSLTEFLLIRTELLFYFKITVGTLIVKSTPMEVWDIGSSHLLAWRNGSAGAL